MLKDQSFDAPIPGMSMTHELGARPWQSPPQYSTVDEVIEYYLERMSSEDFIDQVTDILEMGVPITDVANTLQLGNVMEGVHTIDVGVLVLPVLIEMIMLVGDSAGVEYDSGLSDKAPMKAKRTRDTLVAKTARELQIRLNEKENKEDTPEEIEPMEEEIEQEEDKPLGLMGRRK